MNKIRLYLHSFYQFAKNSLYHKLILITFIITTLISIWVYTHNFINLITAVTAILALFIWFGDLNRSWRGSLNNRLTVFYLAPKKELHDNPLKDDSDSDKNNVLACYVRANVIGDSDIRAFSQQLAVQLLTQYIESLTLKIDRPPLRLKLDIGGINVHHHPNPVYLKNDSGKSKFVNDIIAVVTLNKFVSDLKNEWCPKSIAENKETLSTSKLLSSDSEHFLLATIGTPAADNEALTTLDKLNALEEYAPFSHIIEHVKNELDSDNGA